MPTYAFRCKECEHEFEVNVPWREKEQTRCPACKSDRLHEQFGRYRILTSAPSCGSTGGTGGFT